MKAASTRERLRLAIVRIAKRAANGLSPPDVDDIAIRLSSRYPQSGMTIDEICSEIASVVEKERNQNDVRG
jgi:hypothetical protein